MRSAAGPVPEPEAVLGPGVATGPGAVAELVASTVAAAWVAPTVT